MIQLQQFKLIFYFQYTGSVFLILLSFCFLGCSNTDESVPNNSVDCNPGQAIINSFENSDGINRIYDDGKLFIINNNSCSFFGQYFDPDFLEDNYAITDQGIFIRTDSGELFPINNNFTDTFENYDTFLSLFIQSTSDIDKFWGNMTLQSPTTPNLEDYVALRNCIFENTCDFIDNKIELAVDPTLATNTVLKFTAVAPTPDMVTSKASLASVLPYFTKSDDIWFQADYYLTENRPYSLVDFESSFFFGSPGPRIIIRNNQIAFENKFGTKILYTQSNGISLPTADWFTLKVHLKYSDTNDGVLQVWQGNILIIDTTGINLPTSNSVQNSLEIGISATDVSSTIYMDNLRISDTSF
ncbi:heparin lyase I family protein [uncultured Aquimarina sp.]|uniref:heparin lyase I family protein n=1 Tax=uncultured Aquimarina sp. TaxID=575652 RepID=UPI00262590DC|nr:heparin lyase I family protein [uncultured Aquimarina sp.]